ncbi:hypothetical protein PNOK_0397100 [Pyrrhoderma noxium]|uniref:Uncharacterized protein n=1 Tax=Pyrrhoderma noxium TaxID=2282107 RepID=A0A286UPA7_9AGAM|nr:hypothetical protein PNOK_0397100 [Pyrrhoderma noxium]
MDMDNLRCGLFVTVTCVVGRDSWLPLPESSPRTDLQKIPLFQYPTNDDKKKQEPRALSHPALSNAPRPQIPKSEPRSTYLCFSNVILISDHILALASPVYSTPILSGGLTTLLSANTVLGKYSSLNLRSLIQNKECIGTRVQQFGPYGRDLITLSIQYTNSRVNALIKSYNSWALQWWLARL